MAPKPITKQKVTPAELIARIAEKKEQVEALRELYEYSFPPEFMVDGRQFRTWLNVFDFDLIVQAFEAGENKLNQWLDKAVDKDKYELASYLSGIMYGLKADLEGKPRKGKETLVKLNCGLCGLNGFDAETLPAHIRFRHKDEAHG